MKRTGQRLSMVAKAIALVFVLGNVVLAGSLSIIAYAETPEVSDVVSVVTEVDDLVLIEEEEVPLADGAKTLTPNAVTTIAVCATAAISATGLYVGLSSATANNTNGRKRLTKLTNFTKK